MHPWVRRKRGWTNFYLIIFVFWVFSNKEIAAVSSTFSAKYLITSKSIVDWFTKRGANNFLLGLKTQLNKSIGIIYIPLTNSIKDIRDIRHLSKSKL